MKRSRVSGLALGLFSLAAGCNDSPSAPQQEATTLYFYADYPNPNVTVSVNGTTLGPITTQYIASTECPTILTKNGQDGVLSVTVRLGQHYDLSFKYSNGSTNGDAFTADADIVESQCLIEAIDPPPTADRR